MVNYAHSGTALWLELAIAAINMAIASPGCNHRSASLMWTSPKRLLPFVMKPSRVTPKNETEVVGQNVPPKISDDLHDLSIQEPRPSSLMAGPHPASCFLRFRCSRLNAAESGRRARTHGTTLIPVERRTSPASINWNDPCPGQASFQQELWPICAPSEWYLLNVALSESVCSANAPGVLLSQMQRAISDPDIEAAKKPCDSQHDQRVVVHELRSLVEEHHESVAMRCWLRTYSRRPLSRPPHLVHSNHFRNIFLVPSVKCALRHKMPAFLINSA